MIHQLKINEPIWHKRAIGVNLINTNPDDEIEVEILYTKKDGKRPYPYKYTIKASEAHKHSTQKLRGVVVHIVPLVDLQFKSFINPVNTNP